MASNVPDQTGGYDNINEHGIVNETQIDPNLVGNLLPKLLPRLMEVFTDPSVINEITLHEMNCRRQELYSNSIPINLDRNMQCLQNTMRRSVPNNKHVYLDQRRLLEPLDLENIASNETEEYLSCSSSFTNRKNLNKDTQESSYKNLKNNRTAYCCIIAVVFLLVILLAGCLTIGILWLAVNNGSSQILDQFSDTYKTCTDLLNVSVRSIDEYNAALEVGGKQELSIDIELVRPNDWPTGVKIQSSKDVNDIRINGPFHAKKLVGLLGTINRLEKLHLDNKVNEMCTESMPPIKTFDTSTNLKVTVNQLILERFNSSCTKVLGVLHESIVFHKLETFRFVSGIINSENVRIFEKLLEKHRNSLKRLQIIDSSFEAGIFSGHQSLTFDNVHEIVLETKHNANSKFVNPVFNMCTTFSQVQRLSFGSGLMKWDDVERLFDCNQLKSLQIKIWVKHFTSNFSLSFLAEHFPKLEAAEITILFGRTYPSSEIMCTDKFKSIYGRKNLSKVLLANLRISSNCKLKF